jgi:hypothetical protein
MAVALGLCSCAAGTSAADQDGFRPIFDGRSLTGWETPDRSYWAVEDGAITGRITKEHPCTVNQYLVWKGGELADFELKLKSRLNGESGINNGFQFRSRLLPDHDVCGYQMDNNLQTPWLARLYDEYGRHTLAWRGERATFDADGNRTVTKITEAEGAAWFRLEDWHEYHLICVGPRITLRIDGRLVAEVEDDDARRRELQGILALQLHSGPPTVVQFKDIRLQERKAATPPRKPPYSSTATAPLTRPADTLSPSGGEGRGEGAQLKKRGLIALRREAVAWWALDTGGHGATPPLRHIPGWEKFELNVRAAGPGAREGADVVLLDGAYFDAGLDLHGGEEAVTVYLRARDPRGVWNSALCSKRGSHEQMHFSLFSVDLPETPGPDIGFEIRTDQGFAMVSFPVSQIEATAWHDLVGRYDGKSLEIFCDGGRMAGKPWRGKLQKNRELLLIGAETDSGKVVRHFYGELEEAALWSRALTDEELTLLSGK